MQDYKQSFGSIIVIVLLILYVYSIGTAIDLAYSGTHPVEVLPEGISRTMATVGGLVSALVISQLAVTKPGEVTAAKPAEPSGRLAAIVDTVTPYARIFYVAVWIVMGFVAFVVGELWFPGKVPALTTFAQAWLGLAVAAGYAYFGIDPQT
jgi:hypothetical protein